MRQELAEEVFQVPDAVLMQRLCHVVAAAELAGGAAPGHLEEIRLDARGALLGLVAVERRLGLVRREFAAQHAQEKTWSRYRHRAAAGGQVGWCLKPPLASETNVGCC